MIIISSPLVPQSSVPLQKLAIGGLLCPFAFCETHYYYSFFQLQLCNRHRGTHIEGLEYYSFISKYRFKCCEFGNVAAFLLFPHSSFSWTISGNVSALLRPAHSMSKVKLFKMVSVVRDN